MPRPNILLITTDQQRADTVSALGAPIWRTPAFDALAARGTLFGNCFIQNPICIPSRACLQTGRYTHQHGVRYMESEIDTTPGLPTQEWTVHERLRESGYLTAAFGKIHMMPERGFDRPQVTGGKGQRWTQSTGLPIGPGPLGPQYAEWLDARVPGGYERIYEERRRPEYKETMSALAFPHSAEHHVESWITDNTIDLIKSPPSEPWFAWCGLTGPHGPLDVPPEYLDRYNPDDMPEPPHWDHDMRDRMPYPNRGPRERAPEQMAKARRWTAYYHALVDLIDDQLARITAALDETGGWDNTLVLYTSDHGEMGGDFGLYGKGNFYDAVTRVPTFVIPPGGEPRRFDGLTEMFDLSATILDYAGLATPEHMAARSLRPEMETGSGGRESVFGDYVTNDRDRSGVYCRTESHKLVVWTRGNEFGGELYDMIQDPEELSNRFDDPSLAPVRRELTDRIMQRRLETDCPPPATEWPGAPRTTGDTSCAC
ncbi:MAG TPA: sulfatase-like hydrolase/transferase [Armatimonadota bacterium]|nr:sulfatase-like hydrolase/transferase [Armatimonadota bacterium]